MLGVRAILWEAGFGVIGLFLLTGAITGLIGRQKPTQASKKAFDDALTSKALLIFSIVYLAAIANLMARELRFHSDLSHLRAEAVERIEIGTQSVKDPRQIAEIVDVLNHAQWFSIGKGDGADLVPFTVKLVSGKEYAYQATRYQHGEGAILVSRSPSGWENGQVFCRNLPASLAKAGVKLPPCFTYFSQPLHCAPD